MRWLSKDHGPSWGERATEARDLRRKDKSGVQCVIEFDDGTIRQGTMKDISARGAGVHGTTEGIHLGDHIRLIASNEAGERVRYRCEVKHLNREHRHFGVEFLSRPETLAPDYTPRTNEPETPSELRAGCPRCGSRMEFGHLVDHVHLTSSLERAVQARWTAGPAKRDQLRTDDIPQPVQYLGVDTYRCTQCGYLESYANTPYDGA
jgi:hypothetical protein